MASGKLLLLDGNVATLTRNVSLQPLISVCIPCYNGAEFLGRTIASVLGQTFTDFELILTDDNSTDETVSVINSFTDQRIRLIRNEQNLGLNSNWTKVLFQSVGKYVKLLCEDDLLHPNCLTRQVAVLENPANSRVVLAVCNRTVINRRDEVVLNRRLRLPSGFVDGPGLIRKSVRWGTNLIGEPAVGLFRRDALGRLAEFDGANPYLSDLALWAQLLRHGDAFLDNDCLAAFRISPGAASTNIGRAQAGSFRRFVQALRKDSCFKISALDLLVAYTLSFHWCIFRNLFIHFHPGRPGWMAARQPLPVLWECAAVAAKAGVGFSTQRHNV